MKTCMIEMTGNERTLNQAQLRGCVAYLMANDSNYRKFPLLCMTEWIEPAIMVSQIQVFFQIDGQRPVGYMTWAYLAPDVEARWLDDPNVRLHMSEWNEDGNLWIMDFVAPFGHAREMIALANESLFPQHNIAHSLRRDPAGHVRKRSVWRRRGCVLKISTVSSPDAASIVVTGKSDCRS